MDDVFARHFDPTAGSETAVDRLFESCLSLGVTENAVIDPAERDRARRPFAHIRDEDPRLLAAALAKLELAP